MRVEEEYLDVLQNIEAVVIAVYDDDLGLLDLDVLDALEALIRRYTLEQRGRTPGNARLSERPQRVFDAVRRICEWRLGRSTLDSGKPGLEEDKPTSISVPEILLCLKRLRKSVRLWNKEGGRQGYVNYVRDFLGGAEGGGA
jgi:hypothetical protein